MDQESALRPESSAPQGIRGARAIPRSELSSSDSVGLAQLSSQLSAMYISNSVVWIYGALIV